MLRSIQRLLLILLLLTAASTRLAAAEEQQHQQDQKEQKQETQKPVQPKTFQPGFQTLSIPNGSEAPLQAAVWYPTTATPREERLGPTTQTVALNARLATTAIQATTATPPTAAPQTSQPPTQHPLVLISHGSGGWYGGHADTAIALAKAGFIVAAVTHRGDSMDDQSRVGELWIRPQQLKRLTDYMLTNWPQHNAIDQTKIGVFGFSAGGFTALVASGGTPDLTKVTQFCEQHAAEETCQIVREQHQLIAQVGTLNPQIWTHDDRIKAAVVAAPAVGFTFAPDGLKDVHIPIQLWRAEYDHVLPSPDFAEAVRDALPAPAEYHVVPNMDHYDFLPPCSATQQARVPQICTSRPGFDRAAFHKQFDESVVQFFERALGE